jgi:hypothetical protein
MWHTIGCETTFRSAFRIGRNNRDEIQFHFQNDLPVRLNFQMFISCPGAFREVSTVNLRVFSRRLSLNFHFSAPFPAMAKPHAFWASDFTARAKERIAAEMRVAHDLGSSLPEICHPIWHVGEAARSWNWGDTSPAAQHNRRRTTGRPRKLMAAEEGEILQRTRINFLI